MRSQGVQLATIQGLARYWGTDYDWRKYEATLNALPQFMTEIDGLDIHFIHVRSKHENALPLIVTHGWPGSVIEQLKIIDPLTNPTAHGASASDAFHLVIPSIPGYGFSGEADHCRLGPMSHRTRLGRADEAPWLHAICGARRRLGRRLSPMQWPCRRLRSCWASTPICPAHGSGRDCKGGLQAGARRHPASPPTKARVRAARSFSPSTALATPARWRTARKRCTGSADSPVGLAAWILDHDAASGGANRPRPRRSARGPHARRHPRQLHALLVDEHGGFCRLVSIGKVRSIFSPPRTSPSRPP